MKILFVQPGLEEITNEYPPLGLLYLASVARTEGHIVDLYDVSAEKQSFLKALEYFIDFEPDILAISLYTIGLPQQFEFIKRIKKAKPQCIVIVGGPHATALQEEVLAESHGIDFLIFGEGEKTLIEFLSTLEKGDKFANIKGICYRSGKEIVKNTPQSLLDNLDLIPFPAFDLIRKHNYKYTKRAFEIYENKGVIITSRGCPSKCEFCFKATFGSKLRRRTPQNVVAEMIWQIKELGAKEFQFVDDLFAVNPRWLRDFFYELERNKINVPWKCLSRVTTVKENEIKEMKAHGCYGIEFGVESGNDEILKDIKKGITTNQVRRAFETSRRCGLLTFGFFIFGHKKDTHETIRQTIDFAKEISPDMPGFAVLLPFPGADVYSLLNEDKKKNWEAFNSYYDRSALPISICSVPPEDLKKYGAQADFELYGSLSFLFTNILLRKGIKHAHRMELFEKWLLSLKAVNRLYRNKEKIFYKEQLFFHKYIINLVLIFMAEGLKIIAMIKGKLIGLFKKNAIGQKEEKASGLF